MQTLSWYQLCPNAAPLAALSLRVFFLSPKNEWDLILVLIFFQPNASLFEACCNERIQQFDDNEEEEDIWEEKEITYATQVKSRTR